jgi:hypothetical protein
MIDGRTDIIQYYSKWLENRFDEGFLYTRNPAYPLKVQKIILDHEHIDAIMFTSKNFAPGMELIKKLDKEYPCLYHYTITGYDKDIEPGVPDINSSINTLIELSNIVGKEKVFWRYDPVMLTDKYTLAYHHNMFMIMSNKLSPYINRCIYSYVNLYEKVKRHMPELEDWTDEKKIEIAKVFGELASKYNVKVQTCNCHLDLTQYGVGKSGCITKEIITNVLDLNVKDLKPNGSLGCGFCYPVVNIGEYNTCLNKCKYCYASSDFEACEKNFAKHNPNSPYLIGEGTINDEIVERDCQSIKTNELKLF